MKDKISVIVTLYNRLEYARNMILALQQQTKQIDELIFADDGSSEKLMEYIEDLLVDCNFKIKHVYQDDIGFRLARSRNNGAREASGDYLIFLDQDVIFDNDFIESIYNSRRKKRMIFSEALSSSLEEKNKIQELINQKFDYEKIYKLIDNTKKIEQNKIYLEKTLGEKLYSFAYPYGIFNEASKKIVKDLGFNYGIATDSGKFYIEDDLYQVRRIGIFSDITMSKFKRRVKGNYNLKYIK